MEADEYAGNFDPYRPAVALLTNLEWDHPDVFEDREAVIAAVEAWLRSPAEPVTLVANLGDPGVVELVDRLADWDGRLVAFALRRGAPGAWRLCARLIEQFGLRRPSLAGSARSGRTPPCSSSMG